MSTAAPAEAERVYAAAAQIFLTLGTPQRLRILSSLCQGEKSVNALVAETNTTQSNVSQHLAHLYRAGLVARRRVAQQVFYRIHNERAAMLCRAVCTQVAIELDDPDAVPPGERLLTPHE
ncbi:MAG: winged helix-turn-helix transcriptional regulator [Pelomonas sp.]|nr:winged helix-turn-helix transcriptional regulator [Roseateles sp.]